jgi:hypothetical protein
MGRMAEGQHLIPNESTGVVMVLSVVLGLVGGGRDTIGEFE